MDAINNNAPKISIAASAPALAINELLDERVLAIKLGVSRSTLQSWRYAARGPRYLKLGRSVRYRCEDVETFLNASARGEAA